MRGIDQELVVRELLTIIGMIIFNAGLAEFFIGAVVIVCTDLFNIK
jgi:hypothetical protein